MSGMHIIETDADCNEIAMSSLIENKKTLIVTEKHSFVPSFSVLLKYRDHVFVAETSDYFGAIKSHIGEFKMFIIVGHELDNFQREFFNQICNRLDKTIIHLRYHVAKMSHHIKQ